MEKPSIKIPLELNAGVQESHGFPSLAAEPSPVAESPVERTHTFMGWFFLEEVSHLEEWTTTVRVRRGKPRFTVAAP